MGLNFSAEFNSFFYSQKLKCLALSSDEGGKKVKTLIGSYYINRHSTAHGEKHTAYQIVDYLGHDHIIVKEVGWAYSNTIPSHHGQYAITQSVNEYTNKTSIIAINKIIDDFQKSRLSFYFYEKDVENKLTDLSSELYGCLKAEDIDEWIKSLTKEIGV